MKLKQYKLQSLDTGSFKVCWLDGDLKVGTRLPLKGEDTKYKVVEAYNTEISKEFLDLNRNPEWYSI